MVFQGRSGLVRMASAAAVAASCLAAAACGSSASSGTGAASPSSTPDPLGNVTAAKVQQEVIADAEAAPGLKMDGTVTQTGGTYTINLAIEHDQGCEGTIAVGGNKGSFKLIIIGQTVYLNPDKQFWMANGG